MNKRMSNRWQMRLAAAFNNPTEDYDQNLPVTENGNPTRTDIFPLITGGQLAPRSARQRLRRRVRQPALELQCERRLPAAAGPWKSAGNLFGKQGTPFPIFRNASLGREGTVRTSLRRARFAPVRQSLEPRPALGEERQVRRPGQFAVHRRRVQRVQQRTRRSPVSATSTRRPSCVLSSNLSPRSPAVRRAFELLARLRFAMSYCSPARNGRPFFWGPEAGQKAVVIELSATSAPITAGRSALSASRTAAVN